MTICPQCRETYDRAVAQANRAASENEAAVNRLNEVIAEAYAAFDQGRYGDVRRILTKGRAGILKSHTGVIARNGAR